MKGLNLSEYQKYIPSVNNLTIIYTSLTGMKKKVGKFIRDAIPSRPVFLRARRGLEGALADLLQVRGRLPEEGL